MSLGDKEFALFIHSSTFTELIQQEYYIID